MRKLYEILNQRNNEVGIVYATCEEKAKELLGWALDKCTVVAIVNNINEVSV
jgi:hypothetical protein